MIQTLPGFREFYPEACALKSYIFGIWRQTALNHGFLEIEAPILEPLELFTEKSGPEIAEQLFHFFDKGGRAVALRPELTPSVVRMVGAKAQSLRKPIKWFNIGEQFRFERPQKGRLRSFYQLNVDCFGVTDVTADAEILALLIQLFTAFGLTFDDFKIRLSDRTLWFGFLEAHGLSHEAAVGVLSVIDKLERDEKAQTLAKLQAFLGDKSEVFLDQIQSLIQARSLEALHAVLGSFAKNATVAERLLEWQRLLELLGHMGLTSFIQIDLGIVRGLAYYTGFVFEAFQTRGKARALAGGGRYDTLVEKMRGSALPAIGFAIGDVTFTDLLIEKNSLPLLPLGPTFAMLSTGPAEHAVALRDAHQLRGAGLSVDYPLSPMAFSKQLKWADQVGARFALIYGEGELAQGMVKVRNLADRTEQDIPRSTTADGTNLELSLRSLLA